MADASWENKNKNVNLNNILLVCIVNPHIIILIVYAIHNMHL